jgi:hypothetical protein
MISNCSGLGPDCFDRLVVENAKGKMESIASDRESIVWCG